MSAWLYRNAYILCASRPYTLGDGGMEGIDLADELVHISNLAVNKHTKDHPGQVSGPIGFVRRLGCAPFLDLFVPSRLPSYIKLTTNHVRM